MNKYSLSLVATVFNEEELLESFVRKSVRDLSTVADDFEIILVDDGSTDQSREIENRMADEFPEVKLVLLSENMGAGASYIPGFEAASKKIVFNNTVDAFLNTEDLPKILPFLQGADVVSCYRTDLRANNFYQKILTLGNYWLIRALFPLKLRSYQSAQFHRNDFLRNINIEGRSSFISPELLLKAHSLGRSIKEVPFVFHARSGGKAKGGKLKFILRAFWDILRFWFKWRIRRCPIAVLDGKNYFLK